MSPLLRWRVLYFGQKLVDSVVGGHQGRCHAASGTTPARLRHLKDAIPSSRKITKTDLAKYLHAWAEKPYLVSLGSQKNFERFMENFQNNGTSTPSPDVPTFKQMIAKAILFKVTHRLVRPMFQAFQANVAAYLVSVLASRLGSKMDLDKIWLQQDLSDQLKQQLATWANEVNDALHKSANGEMVSEWSKKAECWEAIRAITFTSPLPEIPEVRGMG